MYTPKQTLKLSWSSMFSPKKLTYDASQGWLRSTFCKISSGSSWPLYWAVTRDEK